MSNQPELPENILQKMEYQVEISASALPMDDDAHYEKLKKGTEFFVYEGQSMVGKGKAMLYRC